MGPKIGKGTRFRSTLADGNPLWEVTGPQGRGAWKAVVVNEPIVYEGRKIDSDFAGTEHVFTTPQIQASVGMENVFKAVMQGHDAYYASLRVGQWVHYDSGHGQYVRCEVVMGKTRDSGDRNVKCLKPIALVGSWHKFDLPCRNVDGSIRHGYQVEKIAKGETMTPNYTNIYEAQPSDRRRGLDPMSMTPIDLSVPEMSPEEAAVAKQWRAVNAAKVVLDDDSEPDPMARLLRAAARVKEVLEG